MDGANIFPQSLASETVTLTKSNHDTLIYRLTATLESEPGQARERYGKKKQKRPRDGR